MSSPAVTVPTQGAPPARRLRGRTLLLLIVALLVAIMVPAVVLPTLVWRKQPPRLDDLGELPAFSLTAQTGARFGRDDLRGKVTIIDFVFTRCDTVCPVLSMKMRRIQEQTFDLGDRIKLVSISVDPGHDTPAVLTEYAKRFEADPTRWVFLTGDDAAVQHTVEDGLMNGYENRGGTTETGAPNIVHSGYFVLLDKDVHIRGFYDSNDAPRVEAMLGHARWLTRQPRRPAPGS